MNEIPGKKLRGFIFAIAAALFSLAVNCGAQSTKLPELAEIKGAAEKGDAKAQDQLGDAYLYRMDKTNAFIWYRKAAEQGVANSQCHVAQILMGQGTDFSGKVTSAEKVDEAMRWYVKSANQNNRDAQFALGRLYEDSKAVKQDFVEAYKWYSLAHKRAALEIVAKTYLDQLILKMSQEQIAEGQKRVEMFLAGGGRELPEPSFVAKLKLSGVSGPENHLLAIINRRTFQAGEDGTVKISGQTVKIKCLEIRKDSVVIKAEGMEKTVELKLK